MAVNGIRLMSPRNREEESYRSPTLIELLKKAGYEVRRSAGGILIVRGLKLREWTPWCDLRNQYK
jgi:hypothetical protein